MVKFTLLVALLACYFGYLSYTYDFLTGGVASALTWSFFVLCTPVADAGFLLDFPLRVLFGIRMVISEIAVWVIAITLNIVSLAWFPFYYSKTLLTSVLHQILIHPWPYWGIVGLSGIGTFLSIRFGDELMDVAKHSERSLFHQHGLKFEIVVIVFLIVIVYAYYRLIASLGIEAVL
jgi:hypothetical protein